MTMTAWPRARSRFSSSAKSPLGPLRIEPTFRDKAEVNVPRREGRRCGDEAGVAAHELDDANPHSCAQGLGVGAGNGGPCGLDGGVKAERLVDEGHVIVDRLRNTDDGDRKAPVGYLFVNTVQPRSVPSPPMAKRMLMRSRTRVSTMAPGSCFPRERPRKLPPSL